MAKSRLVLAAIEGNYAGPWTLVDGFARARVDVRGLAPDDGVKIEFEMRTRAGIQLGAIPLGLGSNGVVMDGWEKFRVVKTVADGKSRLPTTVEVFFDE